MVQTQIQDGQLEFFRGYPVKIGIFEGPLDLLVHLVRREEIEAAEVRIVAITDQFLAYLRTMQEINIEVAGEFIVMAATLLLVKSRSLLPREEAGEAEEEPSDDPAIELARRLAEYRTFKEAAEILESAREARQRIYLRPLVPDQAIGAGIVPLDDVSVFDIVAAMQELLKRAQELPPATIQREEIGLADRIEQIVAELETAPGQEGFFDELVPARPTRLFVIVTFLAVLELMRQGRLRVRQRGAFGRIQLRLVEPETDASPEGDSEP